MGVGMMRLMMTMVMLVKVNIKVILKFKIKIILITQALCFCKYLVNEEEKLAKNKKKKKRTWCRLHHTQCNYICCNRPLLQKKLVIWIYLSNIFSSNIFSSSIHTLRIHSFIDSCINGFEFSFAKVCFAQCSTSRLALGSPGCSVGCSSPCPEYLIKPYNDIFLKSPGPKDIKTDIPNCQIPKYTNTQIQIHKYTNTAYDEMPEIPNICCIFEQLVVQGCQKWYSQVIRSEIRFEIRSEICLLSSDFCIVTPGAWGPWARFMIIWCSKSNVSVKCTQAKTAKTG